MPGLDSTGPMGQGAQTGRRMGKCSGNEVDDTLMPGRRFFRGAGRGIGRRNFKGNYEENFGGRGRGRGRGIRFGMGWRQSQNDN